MKKTPHKCTRCLLCAQSDDKELYPERLSNNSINPYAFSARRERKREHYRIVRCAKCDLVRSNPVLSEEDLTSLYSESSFEFQAEAPMAAETYSQLLENVHSAQGMKLPRSLLEIGCSTGFFIEKALDLGIPRVQGFEPSSQCIDHASLKVKPHILNSVFAPELLNGEQFDCACIFHVIDHLYNPENFLHSVKNNLANGGTILIVCHDVEALSAKLLGSFSPIFDIEHVYLFSQKTLSALVRKVGFKVLECGSLKNKYPVEYWLRMFPGLRHARPLLPDVLKKMPVAIRAGNLYLFAKLPNY